MTVSELGLDNKDNLLEALDKAKHAVEHNIEQFRNDVNPDHQGIQLENNKALESLENARVAVENDRKNEEAFIIGNARAKVEAAKTALEGVIGTLRAKGQPVPADLSSALAAVEQQMNISSLGEALQAGSVASAGTSVANAEAGDQFVQEAGTAIVGTLGAVAMAAEGLASSGMSALFANNPAAKAAMESFKHAVNGVFETASHTDTQNHGIASMISKEKIQEKIFEKQNVIVS